MNWMERVGKTVRHPAVLLALLTVSLAQASAASATDEQVFVVPGVVPPGTSTLVTGTGYIDSPNVYIFLLSDEGPIAVLDVVFPDPFGNFSTEVTIPDSVPPGSYTVLGRSPDSGQLATAPLVVRTDWPQYRFSPSHAGFNRYENVLDAGNVSSLAIDWVFPTDPDQSHSPVVAGGVVYVGSDSDKLLAIDAYTMDLKWDVDLGSDVGTAPAVYQNRVVVVGTRGGSIYGVDASDGSILWEEPTGGQNFSSPALASNGVVYIGSEDGYLYALVASSGHGLWKAPVSGRVGLSSPAIGGELGLVFIGSNSGLLEAFYTDTGFPAWSMPTDAAIEGSPALSHGKVFVGSTDNTVRAFDAADGTPLWTFPTGGPVWSSPAVAYGRVFIGSTDGNLYALDAEDGGPALWSMPTGGSIGPASPSVANGVVYLGAPDGFLHGYDAETGNEVLTRGLTNSSFWSPAIADGRVYLTASPGTIYAFALPSAGSLDVSKHRGGQF